MKRFLIAVLLFSMIMLGGVVNTSLVRDSVTVQASENHISLDELKTKLKIGQSEKEVKSIMGGSYTKVKGGMDNSSMWRYDIDTIEGYKFKSDTDEVDLNGLQSKWIELIVFIKWDEESKTVSSLAAYYVDETDERIHEYRLLSDGTARDTVIY
ncbi:hypothetical protein [Fictibacillus barbaricus]|nr:hypothetical protein [Fictibacillus barbaricus]GGB41606.1 hypothetical protein GCM10007199_03590 [Fictibacillus barbaricus]